MTRAEAIAKLGRYADDLHARGAMRLYLFGSTARDDAAHNSDLDLFLDYDPAAKFSLIDLIEIKYFLEDALDVEVDLTTRDSLHPSLRTTIENSAVRVF
jgi:predicted nucleotidyltransferase